MFLCVVAAVYVLGMIIAPAKFISALYQSTMLFIRLIPVFLMVVGIMGFVSYIIRPPQVKKYVGKGSGITGWLVAIATGILSHGPIYVWYSFLKELKQQGMKESLSAVFLYNRAIKLPLLPVMIYYFGIEFTIILSCSMLGASLLQGLLFELINPE